MGPKIKAGCGILKILEAGYGMKLSWRDPDSLEKLERNRLSVSVRKISEVLKSRSFAILVNGSLDMNT